MFDSLDGHPVRELDDDGLVDVMDSCERLASWAAARQLAAIAELAARRPTRPPPDGVAGHDDAGHPGMPSISEFAVDEVAAALRLSRCAAGARLHLAVELTRLPDTAAALARGLVDVPRVRAIVDAVSPLDGRTAAAVEGRVLPRAGEQTVGRLRASLSRAVLAVDPAGAEVRHRRMVSDRRVAVSPLADGMAELWALLPADDAVATYAALDAVARRAPSGDPRGMDARRADALVGLVLRSGGGGSAGDDVGGSGSLRAEVRVTVPAATALGLADQPGELAGHGPIPASMARRLAKRSTWRRVATDPDNGVVVEVGRAAYTPSAALADLVRARDRTCRFPGCRQPAHRCDLDHVAPYPAGPTTAGNLATLCRHHHRLKHLTSWRVTVQDDAGLAWTSPTGRRYVTSPMGP